jgi:hypothetical protein
LGGVASWIGSCLVRVQNQRGREIAVYKSQASRESRLRVLVLTSITHSVSLSSPSHPPCSGACCRDFGVVGSSRRIYIFKKHHFQI